MALSLSFVCASLANVRRRKAEVGVTENTKREKENIFCLLGIVY